MYGECLFANENCKYYTHPPVPRGNIENGCRSDQDHIVPQRLAQTTLANLYIYSPDNLQQLCRDEHDDKTRMGDEPLPTRQGMLESVIGQIANGKLMVSRETLKQLKEGTI